MVTIREEIFAFIKSVGGKVNTEQVAKKFNLEIASAQKTLRTLIEIRRVGKERGPKARWVISSV